MNDVDKEEVQTLPPLPPSLSATLKGYTWERDTIGKSGGGVYRLRSKGGAPDLFLKYGSATTADEISCEMAALRWLADYLPVPAVTQFVRTCDQAWLLTTAIHGQTAYQALECNPSAGPALVDALAAFLRRMHAIPMNECSFNSGYALRLVQARKRIDADLVDTDDFNEERAGWSADQVWDAMHGLLPLAQDPVVTHGDCSLDNLLVRDGQVVACIDVGRVGVADRYQDLAILWNCLGEFGPELQERLLRQYGVFELDRRKLEFHLMLDELF